MGFNFISGRRCAKTKRTSGKAAGGRVYGWLLIDGGIGWAGGGSEVRLVRLAMKVIRCPLC